MLKCSCFSITSLLDQWIAVFSLVIIIGVLYSIAKTVMLHIVLSCKLFLKCFFFSAVILLRWVVPFLLVPVMVEGLVNYPLKSITLTLSFVRKILFINAAAPSPAPDWKITFRGNFHEVNPKGEAGVPVPVFKEFHWAVLTGSSRKCIPVKKDLLY